MAGYCAAMSNMGTSLCPLNMISEYLRQGHTNLRSHISNKVFPSKKKIVAPLNQRQKIKPLFWQAENMPWAIQLREK